MKCSWLSGGGQRRAVADGGGSSGSWRRRRLVPQAPGNMQIPHQTWEMAKKAAPKATGLFGFDPHWESINKAALKAPHFFGKGIGGHHRLCETRFLVATVQAPRYMYATNLQPKQAPQFSKFVVSTVIFVHSPAVCNGEKAAHQQLGSANMRPGRVCLLRVLVGGACGTANLHSTPIPSFYLCCGACGAAGFPHVHMFFSGQPAPPADAFFRRHLRPAAGPGVSVPHHSASYGVVLSFN
eukprot:gene22186-biopygen17700